MKVLMINHNGGSIYHGPNLRTYYAAKELVNRFGHEVTIVSSSYSHKYSVLPDTTGTITDEKVDGINYKWIKCIKYKNLLQRIYSHFEFGFKFLFNRKKICNEADIIIFSGPPPEIFLFSWIYAKLLKVPIISDIRDLWPLTQIEMSKKYWLNPYTYFLYIVQYVMVKGSNYLLSPLPGAGLYFNKIDSNSNISIIENGFDLKRELSTEDVYLEVLASGNLISFDKKNITLNEIKSLNKLVVGYSGSFDRDNDLDSLVEVIKKFNDRDDIIFLFVGAGKRLEFLIENTLEILNMIVCNRVASQFVPNVLGVMDICYCGLKPKDIYKYGVSLAKTYEYMASSKPIIWMIDAYNNPVKESNGGFVVQAGSVNELCNTLEKAIKINKRELKKLGKNGFEYLEKNFSYEVLGEKWNDLIVKVVKNARG